MSQHHLEFYFFSYRISPLLTKNMAITKERKDLLENITSMWGPVRDLTWCNNTIQNHFHSWHFHSLHVSLDTRMARHLAQVNVVGPTLPLEMNLFSELSFSQLNSLHVSSIGK